MIACEQWCYSRYRGGRLAVDENEQITKTVSTLRPRGLREDPALAAEGGAFHRLRCASIALFAASSSRRRRSNSPGLARRRYRRCRCAERPRICFSVVRVADGRLSFELIERDVNRRYAACRRTGAVAAPGRPAAGEISRPRFRSWSGLPSATCTGADPSDATLAHPLPPLPLGLPAEPRGKSDCAAVPATGTGPRRWAGGRAPAVHR